MSNNTDLIGKLESFQSLLNSEPPQDKIKTMSNFKYLPISYHEATMDRLFFGLWSSEVLQAQQVLNEIICTVKITYTHPVNQKEYTRTGVASVQIQQDSGTKICDFTTYKKANALQLCLPKARAEAFKNATQQLGKVFGRDLARKTEHISEFKPIMNGRESAERKGLLMLVKAEIDTQTNLQELNAYMRSNIEYLSDKDIQAIYNTRLGELKQILLPQKSE